mgnify:CR=1 FL=1
MWPAATTERGRAAEQIAAQFLQQQGLIIVGRNVRLRRGEIDIIARDGDSWVFIEVKWRQRNDYGGAAAALGPAQCQRIRRSASLYLQQQRLQESRTLCRFDVVLVAADGQQCEWLANAF